VVTLSRNFCHETFIALMGAGSYIFLVGKIEHIPGKGLVGV
jgi:hypothetical protein